MVNKSVFGALVIAIAFIFVTNSVHALSATISPTSNVILDQGQSGTWTVAASQGTSPYAYNAYATTTAGGSTFTTNNANTIFNSGSSSGEAQNSTLTFATTTGTTAGTYQFYDQVTDSSKGSGSAVTTVTVNAIVNTAMTTPTISPSNPTIDNGQSVSFTSTWSGGTPDYTAKLYSSSTSTCNTGSTLVQTLSSLSSGSASFSSVRPSSTPTTYYCIFVTDRATTPVTVNSINSEVVVSSALGIPTISPTSPTYDIGQTITFTNTPTTGTSPYTWNFIVTNSIGSVVYNSLSSSESEKANTELYSTI